MLLGRVGGGGSEDKGKKKPQQARFIRILQQKITRVLKQARARPGVGQQCSYVVRYSIQVSRRLRFKY